MLADEVEKRPALAASRVALAVLEDAVHIGSDPLCHHRRPLLERAVEVGCEQQVGLAGLDWLAVPAEQSRDQQPAAEMG